MAFVLESFSKAAKPRTRHFSQHIVGDAGVTLCKEAILAGWEIYELSQRYEETAHDSVTCCRACQVEQARRTEAKFLLGHDTVHEDGGDVYVLYDPQRDVHKIGLSNAGAYGRMKHLQQTHGQLYMCFTVTVDFADIVEGYALETASRLEKALYGTCDYVGGEWFHLTAEQCRWCVRRAVEIVAIRVRRFNNYPFPPPDEVSQINEAFACLREVAE